MSDGGVVAPALPEDKPAPAAPWVPSLRSTAESCTFVAYSKGKPPRAPPSRVPFVVRATHGLVATYTACRPGFSFGVADAPQRVLTTRTERLPGSSCDNVDNNLIVSVRDVLGDGVQYEVEGLLGQGTFGQVLRCKRVDTGDGAAVKVIKNHPAYTQQAKTEVAVLESVNALLCETTGTAAPCGSPQCGVCHLLRLRRTFVHKDHLCLAFDLLGPSLYDTLKAGSFLGMPLTRVRSILTQLLSGLRTLHNARIMHCDIKPENVLLNDGDAVRLIDFGSSCMEGSTTYSYIMSRFYRAPEVLLGLPYDCAIDMWSLGCLAAELWLGLPLAPGVSQFDQLAQIVALRGMPPQWMLLAGTNTAKFFAKAEARPMGAWPPPPQFELRDGTQKRHQAATPAPKRYFTSTNLHELLTTYSPHPKTRTSKPVVAMAATARERSERAAFAHFCAALLQVDPVLRPSPAQALLHPFMLGTSVPVGYTPPTDEATAARRRMTQQQWRGGVAPPVPVGMGLPPPPLPVACGPTASSFTPSSAFLRAPQWGGGGGGAPPDMRSPPLPPGGGGHLSRSVPVEPCVFLSRDPSANRVTMPVHALYLPPPPPPPQPPLPNFGVGSPPVWHYPFVGASSLPPLWGAPPPPPGRRSLSFGDEAEAGAPRWGASLPPTVPVEAPGAEESDTSSSDTETDDGGEAPAWQQPFF